MKDQNRKKIVLSLRWTVIIVTSYLLFFGKGRMTDPNLGHLFILAYIFSNFILIFLPKAWFYNPKFFYLLVVFDTGIVSLGMYLSESVTTDFYLVYFLILIFASMSRNLKLLMVISGAIAFLYGLLLYSWGLLDSEQSVSYALRIPFIFIMSLFYGYIIQTFTKESQHQRALSEDKYRGLFENDNDGIIIMRDVELQIVDVNREVERLTGYRKGELLQRSLFELFESAEEGRASNYFEQVLSQGEARTDSLSLIRKDRAPLEVDLSTKRIHLEDESFYQAILRDLSEQRRLEKKIRQGKMNFQAVFDGIQDRLSIQTPDYRILGVNKAVMDHHRTHENELIGKECYEAYFHKVQPCEKCPVAVTIETGQPASSILKISEENTILRVFSYPMLDEKGNLLSVIEYIWDITEEQRYQEQLIQSEKLAGIGILASGVAHEINNPLTGIIGMTEIALEEEAFKNHPYLMDILRCAQRISEIVKGLRSYYRTAKKEEYSLVDLKEVLEDCLKMVRMTINPSKVEVIERFQSIEKIEANVGEIQHVFTNLITNAFQAMDKKGGKLGLSTQSLKDWVEVKVSDSGMGIPSKYLNQVFDPFFTTRNPGGGTGLGLNVVYRIVTKYEGTVDIESEEGIGTTFTVKFPIRKEER